jgi:phage tail-like protein
MTCAPDQAMFRLLDALVGWDVDVVEKLSGLDAASGITLTPLAEQSTSATLSHALPPARLARGCGPCEWFLVTCCPPKSRLLRLNPCASEWQPVWAASCDPAVLGCATAIAVHCDRLAIADVGAHRVWIWRRYGQELVTSIPLAHPGPIAWAPWGEWLIVDRGALRLRRFDPAGHERDGAVPLPGAADRIGVDQHCRVWLITREQNVHRIWRWARGESRFLSQSVQALLAAFPDTHLRHVSDRNFCIEASDGSLRCFDCHGRDASMPEEEKPPQLYEMQGQLLTLAIDSGMPRTRWHRVRIDADVPTGTDVSVAVSTQEEPTPAPQGFSGDRGWESFAAGVVHPSDWESTPHGAFDLALSQPPGRYIFVRIRLSGDGQRTPVVRRIRMDFPRRTSLDSLPGVYRENPQAEAFTERFLAIFDAAIEDIDRVIERHPALLDVQGVPNEVLPWLGSFLDVAMDPSWTEQQRRAVLKAVPELYRRRGTSEGLRRTLQLLFGTDVAIDESGPARPWSSVGQARLDSVRLFGRSDARMRVGRSALSRTRVWSVGNPDLDPLNAGAFRFRVLVPKLTDSRVHEQLTRVVEAQKPAHTVASVHSGGQGFIVGQNIHVGIDTAFVPLPLAVLGSTAHDFRLGRNAVLGSRYCSSATLRVGRTSAIGIHTVME